MEPLIANGWGFALVAFRAAALCMTAPVLGSPSVPARLRLAIALALSVALYSAAGAPAIAPPQTIAALLFASGGQTLLGLVTGLGARFVLDAALGVGHLAGLSMGMGYGALLDPNSGAEAPALGNLFSMTAMGCAVALGAHAEAVRWLFRSLQLQPPGAPIVLEVLAANLLVSAITGATLAIRLGLPFLGAITLGHLSLGLLGRAAPQLNLSNLGFTVAIFAGGIALWSYAPEACQLAAAASLHAFAP